MSPIVSVITRTKNRALFLYRCKESLICQKFKNFEWIIINDGFVDDLTIKFFKSLSNSGLRYSYFEIQEAVGMEGASNIGVNKAEGKYITFLDDDDSWHPEFLDSCICFLESFVGYKGVVTQSTIIQENIQDGFVIHENSYSFNPLLVSISIYLLCRGNVFTNNSFVYHRSVFEVIGYFDESLIVKGDWDFNLRFVEKYDIGVIPKSLAFWHHHKSNREEFQNSITKKNIEHRIYEDLIRNKYFRRDINLGQTSIGYFLALYGNQSVFQPKKSKIRKFLDFLKFS